MVCEPRETASRDTWTLGTILIALDAIHVLEECVTGNVASFSWQKLCGSNTVNSSGGQTVTEKSCFFGHLS